jgi:hypothetical protein
MANTPAIRPALAPCDTHIEHEPNTGIRDQKVLRNRLYSAPPTPHPEIGGHRDTRELLTT